MTVSTLTEYYWDFTYFKGSEQGYDRVLSNITAYSHLAEEQVRSIVADQLSQSSSDFSLPSTSSGKILLRIYYLKLGY